MSHLKDTVQKFDPNKMHILFVGGCGIFGMNMTAYIYQRKLYLVDVGLAFADEYQIGIDAYIPDIQELVDCFGGVTAYLITHGHEDHVGGLPLLLEKWNAPVYATAWTLKIFEDRLRKFGNRVKATTHQVKAGDTIPVADIKTHWIHKPHSIPECCSILISYKDKKIYHTGDFKMDAEPLIEDPPNYEHIKSLGPVTALIADSTNASKEGFCPGERSVLDKMVECFQRHPDTRLLFTTFSSNFWRLKTVFDACRATDRKIFVAGASLRKTLEIASSLGYHSKEELIIDPHELKKLPRNKVLILASGSQGEPRSGLRRIIFGENRHVEVEEGDCLIMSSRVIPGNEKSVAMLVSAAHKAGLLVEDSRSAPGIHVSGHAQRGDLAQLIDLTQPEFYIPVHGTFTQLLDNGELHQRSVDVENGTVLEVGDTIQEVARFDFPNRYIDSWSQRPMSYTEMRSRHKIGDSGMMLITGSSQEPVLEIIGIPFDSDQHKDQFENYVIKTAKQGLEKHENADDWNQWVQVQIRRKLAQRLVKKPVVFCRMSR